MTSGSTSNELIVTVIGRGFIGQMVASALERRAITVRRLAAPRVLGQAPMSSPVIEEQFAAEIAQLTHDLEGSAVVINAAGIAESTSDLSQQIMGANAILPGIIGHACDAAGVSRYIHISSAAVQGRISELDDSWNTMPFSPYSQSKALGEISAQEAGPVGTVIYRPPGVHAADRAVTRSLVRLARSGFASVAGTGAETTPQALAGNVADAVAHLATTSSTPPDIVNHPSEGITTRDLLSSLGAREPRKVPAPIASLVIGIGFTMTRGNARLGAHLRRLEVLWFGQGQRISWLTRDGWAPVEGSKKWKEIGAEVHAAGQVTQRPNVLFGVTSGLSVPGFFTGMLRHLNREGWRVAVMASEDARAERLVESEGARYIRIHAARQEAPLSDLGTFLRIVLQLRREKPTVAVWGTPKVGLLGTVASRATGVPSIYVLHGLRLETVRGLKRLMLLGTERLAMASANEVIAVGCDLRQEALKLRLVSSQKIRVLGNGSANGVVASNPSPQARQSLDLQPDIPVVGFAGRVTRDKGLIDLLRAWPRVRRSTGALLVIAGHREDDSYVEPIAGLLLGTAGVRYLGNLEDLTDFYSAIDVLALPSYREGLSTVVLEAASYRRPAVVSNATGVAEAVIDGQTGAIFPKGDVRALEVALIDICTDLDQCAELGERAHAHVMRTYSQTAVHENWTRHLSKYR